MQLRWVIWLVILTRTCNPLHPPSSRKWTATHIKLIKRLYIVHEPKQRHSSIKLRKTHFKIFLQNSGYYEKQIISFSKSQWIKMKNFKRTKKYFYQGNVINTKSVLHIKDFLTRIHFTVWTALGSLLLAAQWSGIFPSISGIPIFESCFMRSFTCSGLL